MKLLHLIPFAFLLLPSVALAQTDEELAENVEDSLYREDQFYLGFTYNILMEMPNNVSSSGFSGGMELGFIRDFPLNYRRNVALGIGLGWAINTYGHTLFIGEEAETEKTIFQALNGQVVDYDQNRFTTQSVEMPLQFRWRTSSPDNYKFWRIYSGLQLGYIYYFRSNFEQPGNTVRQTDVPELNRFRLGATFAFGYNTFNFYFHYGLNKFFDRDAKLDGAEIGITSLRIGLMFYIL